MTHFTLIMFSILLGAVSRYGGGSSPDDNIFRLVVGAVAVVMFLLGLYILVMRLRYDGPRLYEDY